MKKLNIGEWEMQGNGLYEPTTEHDACGVGFVADLNKPKSHATIQRALKVLANMQHRGAVGSDPQTGDGAGILFALDHLFLSAVAKSSGFTLPQEGQYATGLVFLPCKADLRKACIELCEAAIVAEGFSLIGWREVPVEPSALGSLARKSAPYIAQLFVGSTEKLESRTLERKLYVLRRIIEKQIALSSILSDVMFHIPSLSSKTIVYKGLLLANQIAEFYFDLRDERLTSKFAVVHQRYSTNTFPSWQLAHPYRFLAHNGEINTLRGNLNWMKAREALLGACSDTEEFSKISPIIPDRLSDSGALDATVEFLYHTGRSLAHCMAMLIPEAWEHHSEMSAEKRSFYEYQSFLMEPWDGPASLVFTDGVYVGAVLDRNGLRPSRYTVTKDGLVVLASETGTLELEPESISYNARLAPGCMLLLDLERGRIIPDAEVKETLALQKPYTEWVNEQSVSLDSIKSKSATEQNLASDITEKLRAFGYTEELFKTVLAPMATNGEEALGSMGSDTPFAVFSNKRPLLYNYFRELFAQVTNPPLDAIREELVTSLRITLGASKSIATETAQHCQQLVLDKPIISPNELASILNLNHSGIKAARLSMTYSLSSSDEISASVLISRVEQLQKEAVSAVERGVNVLVLSDRDASEGLGAIPALLACSAVHHHLLQIGKRLSCGIVVESAEPREAHHFAALLGYGAAVVCPYLALDAINFMTQTARLKTKLKTAELESHYLHACNKGVRKIMSKMGISTVQSYCGAQIFEAFGLGDNIVSKFFPGTVSRIGGAELGSIALENVKRYRAGYSHIEESAVSEFESGGEYQWRRGEEEHLNDPIAISTLQQAVRQNSPKFFRDYSMHVNARNKVLGMVRSLVDFDVRGSSVPIEEVEPIDSIVRRFKTGAMSFGSISFEAHATLAIAMNRLGGKSNTGEGGEDPIRYQKFDSHQEMIAAFEAVSPLIASVLEEGDSTCSAIKQVASARFGVTSSYLVNAEELQIKMAQGAKPGEGGQLPGHKVDNWIARVRHSTPGVGLISPPPHHDIYSIEDLAQLIHDLKNANSKADISVKLVSEVGVGTIAAGVAKAKADVILISGADGGTGASPLTSIKYAGLPWELGLSEAHQVLMMNGLRNRVRLEVDGQLKTGRDVAIAALLGAEEFGFATAPLISSGCVMMRKCQLNTCNVGVATQDPRLRAKFSGRPEYVINFMRMVAGELREIMAALGFRTVDEMVGRTDCLRAIEAVEHAKLDDLAISRVLYQPAAESQLERFQTIRQEHFLNQSLDAEQLITLARPALEHRKRIYTELPIRNIHRVVGTQLGSEVTRCYGAEGLPEDTIHFKFLGSAGQSFAAFIPAGMTLEIEGEANDFLGKGLSGGKIIVAPPKASSFDKTPNIIIGNVALYGATSGSAYIRGSAGERFCVRNSGASAVVEGVGEHGCEYMTGGRVVVLGPVGRNFAAGMSGGIAYVLSNKDDFERRCNTQMVGIEALSEEQDISELEELIRNHGLLTGSPIAELLLEQWERASALFVKVVPHEYKRVLERGRVITEMTTTQSI